MTCAIITITTHGLLVAKKLQDNLNADLYAPKKIIPGNSKNINTYETGTRELVGKIWKNYDSFIFIMALGIVTRTIKDHIKDKLEDPAVVVVDELGRYAISALSGHEGGANRLAEKVAMICQGDFVITTGSEATKSLVVGMGCRRGTSAVQLEEALLNGLKQIGHNIDDVRLITSVEDKRDEEGLLQLSDKLNIPLKFISKNLIKAVEDNFSKSETVKKALGVYSVAEPCAILGGFRCQMLLPKTTIHQITVAIAEEKFL